ncbi:DoxX family protein [Lapillicoccus jejuensis]|uniref:Putative membrane protein YphA (DoxX/SURF4 family) n=1 Tax=Lapillicoccus jejuensis TaxID=402171 RepID=A0A542E548_9MICO|nr:DoxX family protein [Lapillicoccus jejuensis]TQJ10437.1 putative membrane protein YphA (DoxX/SURF4 family) [Lapillicoccus jejuensis]
MSTTTEPFAGLGPTEDDAATTPQATGRSVTDRWDGALGLLLLRLGTAALLAVTGLQKIDQRPGTVTMLRTAGLPAPDVLGALLGPVQLAMAVALVLGLAVRVVGLGLLAQSVVALVLVDWSGRTDVFLPGVSGLAGERQLLLAAIGAALLGLGGGGLALDRRVRARRRRG